MASGPWATVGSLPDDTSVHGPYTLFSSNASASGWSASARAIWIRVSAADTATLAPAAPAGRVPAASSAGNASSMARLTAAFHAATRPASPPDFRTLSASCRRPTAALRSSSGRRWIAGFIPSRRATRASASCASMARLMSNVVASAASGPSFQRVTTRAARSLSLAFASASPPAASDCRLASATRAAWRLDAEFGWSFTRSEPREAASANSRAS